MNIKVRFETWYWGKYCFATKQQSESLPQGFEIYNEERHGWKNSEEFKIYGKKEYEKEETNTLNYFLNSSFYKNNYETK